MKNENVKERSEFLLFTADELALAMTQTSEAFAQVTVAMEDLARVKRQLAHLNKLSW